LESANTLSLLRVVSHEPQISNRLAH